MKKKGFTLIELLAVIVILAIIALIAVPIILNMINQARKAGAKSSAYGYIEAVEYNVGLADVETPGYTNINLPDGSYTVAQISANQIKLKGKKPSKGTVTLIKRKVSYAKLAFDGFWVEYDGKEAEVTGRYTPGKVTITFKNGETTIDTRQVNEGSTIGSFPNITLEEGQTLVGWYTESSFTNKVETTTTVDDDMTYFAKIDKPVSYGTILYFDPVSEDKCDSTTFSVNSINNNTSTCYKWRVIGQEDNNLIVQMDHNLINLCAWAPKNSTLGPTTVLNSLASATTSWTRVPTLNYTYDTTTSTYSYGIMKCINGICKNSETNNVIAGSVEKPIRARLMTGEELKRITLDAGALSNSTAGKWAQNYNYGYNFSNKNKQIGNLGDTSTILSWLIENTTADANSEATDNIYGNGNNKGYWILNTGGEYRGTANNIRNIGDLSANYTYFDIHYGARPVITMPKSVFSS